jgi:hypothetical protein
MLLVDHRDAEPLGQQHLVEDVAEAAEADHQDAGLGMRGAAVLAPAGEFAFVLLPVGQELGLVDGPSGRLRP